MPGQNAVWTGTYGYWEDASNWSTGSAPGPADSVTIGVLQGGSTILSSPASVANLTITEFETNVFIRADLDVSGQIDVQNGFFEPEDGATVTADGGIAIGLDGYVYLFDYETSVINADIVNDGSIQVAGPNPGMGSLTINGDVTGSGSIFVGGSGTLEITGSVSAQTTALSSRGALKLDDPGQFSGPLIVHDSGRLDLSGVDAFGGSLEIAANGSIDLVGLSVSSYSYDGDLLTLNLAGGGSLAFDTYYYLEGNGPPVAVDPGTYGYQPVLTSDGAGGTLLTMAPVQGHVTYHIAKGMAPVAMNPRLDFSGVSGTIVSANVWISGGYLLGDQLSFTNQSGITGSYDPNSGVLTLRGAASLAAYEAALDTVGFSTGTASALSLATHPNRTISFVVSDASNGSDVKTATVDLVTAPAISDFAGVQTVADTTITSATIAITGGFRPGDMLNVSKLYGLNCSYDAATGVLTLTGAAPNADYADALGSIAFFSTAADPTFGGTDDARTVSMTISDGVLSSNTVTTTFDLVPDHIFTLTAAADSVMGKAGENLIVATANTLNPGDVIDVRANEFSNVLKLSGGGVFDLRAPNGLDGVDVVQAQEGQWAASGSQQQVIHLRGGMNWVVNVASDSSLIPGDPNPPTIVIYGAGDSDLINLGSGADTVFLGGASETVNGGAGTDVYYVTAKTEGATIHGGPGQNLLHFTGGGAVAVGPSITGIQAVYLDNPAAGATQPDYVFAAPSMAGLQIYGSNGNDTITVGAASQFVKTGTGSTRIVMTSATAGADVYGRGATTLALQGGGTFTLNSQTWNVTAELDQAGTLVLNRTGGVSVTSLVGGNTVAAQAGSFTAATRFVLAGSNTLQLQGGGTFDLTTAAAFSGITTIDVQEGQFGATRQAIRLRSGVDVTVNVASAGPLIPGDPNPASIAIVGADDADVINLGAGEDSVTLGSSAETVNGGAGVAWIYADADTLGAKLTGGTGVMIVEVSGGGTMAMNAGDAGLYAVALQASARAYDFTANGQAGLIVDDQSAGADRLTAGGANQILTGGAAGQLTMTAAAAGHDVFGDASAVFNGDTITNFGAADGDIIDVTDMASSSVVAVFTENAGGTAGVLTLSDGTHTAAINLIGQFAAAGFDGDAAAAGFTVANDGAVGTKVTWALAAPH